MENNVENPMVSLRLAHRVKDIFIQEGVKEFLNLIA